MKLVCNTSEALLHTAASTISLPMMEAINAADLKTSLSAKFEMVLDKILEIQSQGDKVVLFTKYTNLGLFLIGEELKKHRVKHVLHWGTGMTDKRGMEVQDAFNRDPSVTVFASSGRWHLRAQPPSGQVRDQLRDPDVVRRPDATELQDRPGGQSPGRADLLRVLLQGHRRRAVVRCDGAATRTG